MSLTLGLIRRSGRMTRHFSATASLIAQNLLRPLFLISRLPMPLQLALGEPATCMSSVRASSCKGNFRERRMCLIATLSPLNQSRAPLLRQVFRRHLPATSPPRVDRVFFPAQELPELPV